MLIFVQNSRVDAVRHASGVNARRESKKPKQGQKQRQVDLCSTVERQSTPLAGQAFHFFAGRKNETLITALGSPNHRFAVNGQSENKARTTHDKTVGHSAQKKLTKTLMKHRVLVSVFCLRFVRFGRSPRLNDKAVEPRRPGDRSFAPHVPSVSVRCAYSTLGSTRRWGAGSTRLPSTFPCGQGLPLRSPRFAVPNCTARIERTAKVKSSL